ncbi:MAG TPA: TfoX/Sxy family protein, partial [Xanthomonadales bacterium]|nr:TfoX/Sxy family protein [Xanthomonadales bacterium]
PVTVRAMFGGHGIYRDGTIFAIAIGDALYLKADEQTRDAFAAAGSTPFVYAGGKTPVTMSYWSVPDAAIDSPQDLLPWAKLAWAAALRKPKPKPKRKAPPTRRRAR